MSEQDDIAEQPVGTAEPLLDVPLATVAATRAALEAGEATLPAELAAASAFAEPVFTTIEPGEVDET